MIKFSVCYSNKSGGEFASCGLSEIELDHSILDDPSRLRDEIAGAYEVCERMVHAQLGTTPVSPAPPPVNPAVARMSAAPPAVPSPAPAPQQPPPAHASGSTPKTGKQLFGFARDRDCVGWFNTFGKAQRPSPLPKLLTDWSPEWVAFAYSQFMAAQSTPAETDNRNGH